MQAWIVSIGSVIAEVSVFVAAGAALVFGAKQPDASGGATRDVEGLLIFLNVPRADAVAS